MYIFGRVRSGSLKREPCCHILLFTRHILIEIIYNQPNKHHIKEHIYWQFHSSMSSCLYITCSPKIFPSIKFSI